MAAALVMMTAFLPDVGVGVASAAAPNPKLNCQPETYPTTNGSSYQAPFGATLNGGYLSVAVPGAMAGVIFGPPEMGYPDGTLFGEACGLLTLPSLDGPIAGNPYGFGNKTDPTGNDYNPLYNNNFILHGPPACQIHYPKASVPANVSDQTPVVDPGICNQNNPVPVSLAVPGTLVPMIGTAGLSGLSGYGSADGVISASIVPTTRPDKAEPNGGFDVEFTTTAKATAIIDPAQLLGALAGPQLTTLLGPLLTPLQTLLTTLAPNTGGECSLAVGDLRNTGLPSADFDPNGPFTSGVTLKTNEGSGQPITGPISAGQTAAGVGNVIGPGTAGQGVAYSNSFPIPPVSPDMPPDPGAPGAAATAPSTLCQPLVAQLFNTLLGLGTSGITTPGDGVFKANVVFSANVAQ